LRSQRDRHAQLRQFLALARNLYDVAVRAYSALYTIILNLIVTVVLTPVFNAISAARTDATVAADYHA